MNLNSKILNKMFNTRIQEHIKTILHLGQVDFIWWMQVLWDLQKSINVIHYTKKLKEKNQMVILSYAKKTSDKI